MRMFRLVALVVFASWALAGCTATQKTTSAAAVGGAVGGIGGAFIAGPIGAVAGAAAGAGIGAYSQSPRDELR